jgi:hypothetical protein
LRRTVLQGPREYHARLQALQHQHVAAAVVVQDVVEVEHDRGVVDWGQPRLPLVLDGPGVLGVRVAHHLRQHVLGQEGARRTNPGDRGGLEGVKSCGVRILFRIKLDLLIAVSIGFNYGTYEKNN